MKKILILGYGKMGKIYVKVLNGLGITDDDMIIVDSNPERIAEAVKNMPSGVLVFSKMEGALTHHPETAFVLTNTNFHAEHISFLLRAGIKNIFAEKPLVYRAEDIEGVRALLRPTSRVFVAYLLNFSPTVNYLINFMRDRGLELMEARGVWGKNRSFDDRMTAGDMEDEMVHMQQMALLLVRSFEKIKGIDISANISFLPYASEEAQNNGHELDPSVPLSPSSSVSLCMNIFTDTHTKESRNIPCFLMSSYISPQQTRMFDVVIGKNGIPTHFGRLLFNVGEKSTLFLKESGSKNGKEIRVDFTANVEVQAEVGAFLSVINKGETDPRMTGFEDAALSVRITEAANRSNEKSMRTYVGLS